MSETSSQNSSFEVAGGGVSHDQTSHNQFRTMHKYKKYSCWSVYLILLTLSGQLPLLLVSFFPSTSNSLYDFNIEQYPPEIYMNSLESLCNATVWKPNLFLNCTNIILRKERIGEFGEPQGLFNVYSAMVCCLRWAIDGGMGFIIPRLAFRSDEELGYFSKFDDFSVLFDEDHLRKKINAECPQLKIYNTYHDVDIRVVAPEHAEFSFHTWGTYRKHLYELLQTKGIDLNSSQAKITVWENRVNFGWEFYKESYSVHASLNNAIQFQPYLVDLGLTISNIITSNYKTKRYVGFHLRIEPDANWYDYDTLVTWFLQELNANHPDIKMIYVSVGVQEYEEKFRADMHSRNYTVISKWMLASLNSNLRDKLTKLNFDQQAIVDYTVMEQSYSFFGVGESSFSFALAYERGKGNLEKCNCHIFRHFNPTFIRTY